jgi:hypothetical protein
MAVLVGCRSGSRIEPVSIANPTIGPTTIAVAPALNLSGSADFDPDRFADLMASELSYADGISVIPVSRVLGVLAAQGLDGVQSPRHALELTGWLGADAILVFAVTEYDPYDPPSIGISAQLYGAWARTGSRTLDPTALARQPGPASEEGPASRRGLLAQSQRVYDASHESVVADVRRFAQYRAGDASPYGWRKYLVSQQHYIRFCCHATIRALLNDQGEAEGASVDQRE